MRVQFLVVGEDGPDFVYGPSPLHEAHQLYMDGWSDALIARGPTLTSDGTQHTGSVHVVDVRDDDVASRFARDEPYALAGWYSRVSITPLEPCTRGKIWDRPRPPGDQPAAFVSGRCTPVQSRERVAEAARQQLSVAADPQWLFAALALNKDRTRVVGVVGAIDLTPSDAQHRLQQLTQAATGAPARDVECRRWMRGGRSAG